MRFLGVHIDKPFLRLALLERKKGQLAILSLKSILLEEKDLGQEEYILSFKGEIRSSLPTKYILLKPLEVKTASPKHFEKIIAFQSEAAHYFNPKEVLSVPHIVKKGKEKTEIHLLTVPRTALERLLQELEKLHIDPDMISPSSEAILQYAKWKFPDLEEAFFIDIGHEEISCICMERGQLKKCLAIEGGIESLLDALWEDRKKNLFRKEVQAIAKQIDLLQLKPHLNPHLFTTFHQMKQEIGKVIYSFSRLHGSKPLFFTGQTEAFLHTEKFFQDEIEEFVVSAKQRSFPLDEQKYAIAIGLCLQKEDGPNFRKEEFFPSKQWKKAGKRFIFLAAASLTIGLTLVTASQWITRKKTAEMVHLLDEAVHPFDPELCKTLFSSQDGEEILSKWARTVTSSSKESPYLIPFPKVTHALSWLYQMPLVSSHTIEISHFHYALLQYPTIASPKTPYEAKVELEFKTGNSTHAKRFHEQLLQGEGMVDATKEIAWDPLEDRYRVSFFLKKEKNHDL